MKKITVLFILFFIATLKSFAQDYQEVVYLTDGSIIKGFILEQVPNDYLKIETASGKIYTIDMYEVEKITKVRSSNKTQSNRTQDFRKENERRNTYNNQYNNQYNNRISRSKNNYHYYEDEYDDSRDYSYFPNMGYKGFIDLGYSFGTRSKVGPYKLDGEDRIEFATSHGYFFNPYIFIGLGFGIHYYTASDYYSSGYHYETEDIFEIPIFAHIRSHFTDSKASPFVDMKLGYTVYDVTGLYFSPSVGCRLAKGSRSAFWISVGYSIQKIDDSYYGTSASSDAVSLKVGWDF